MVRLCFMCMILCVYLCVLRQALMSLFVLASKDGWVNIMYHGLDAVGIDQQVITYTYFRHTVYSTQHWCNCCVITLEYSD